MGNRIDDRLLRFVLEHFEYGRFDVGSALGRFRQASGIGQKAEATDESPEDVLQVRRGRRLIWAANVAAAVLLVLG